MGKPTGFLDYERKNAKAEAPLERIKHFNEFHTPLSREEQEKQGARCMAVSYTHLPVKICISGVSFKGGISRRLYSIGVPAILNMALPSLLISALNGILAEFSQSYVLVLSLIHIFAVLHNCSTAKNEKRQK